MAGTTAGEFREKLSGYLRGVLAEAEQDPGRERLAEILRREYLIDPNESDVGVRTVSRHYQAEIGPLPGLERLYRRTVLVEPTTACAAHCRWCVRGNYDQLHLNDSHLRSVAEYCGSSEVREDVREVLITGGDPLLVPAKLSVLFSQLVEHAPNVETFRVGTRLPLHDPARIEGDLLRIFERFREKIEIAIHINHRLELLPEVLDAIARIRATGVTIYNQTVLLKGVNDSLADLVELMDTLRSLRIENHYLFHCVPMKGMNHHRTSLDSAMELARRLSNSGVISGRARPVFSIISSIGKIIPYEGTILERDGARVLLQSDFRLDERLRYNPDWKLPEQAMVGDDGRLRTWYEDAIDAG